MARASWLVFEIVLGATLCACGSGTTAAPAVKNQPDIPPAPLVSAEPSQPESDTEAASALVAKTLERVAALRHLPAKGQVASRTLSRSELTAHVQRIIDSEVPKDVVRGSEYALLGLGVVPRGFDYRESLLELMGAELAGLYDPDEKAMYLAADLGETDWAATLSHELVHALQDQHFDLGRHTEWQEDASDRQSAVHALAEGDATSAMLDDMLAEQGARAIDLPQDMLVLQIRTLTQASTRSAGVPGVLKRSVISPYVDGLAFVHWLRRRGGWERVNAAWKNPPTTTEQLLHPEKYEAQETAELIAVPEALGEPSKLLYRDIFGEQSVRLVFEEWMPPRVAEQAAAGWDGDRLAVFADGERASVVWHLRYDSVEDAQRVYAGFVRGALHTARGKRGLDADGSPDFVPASEAEAAARKDEVCRERRLGGPFATLRRERDVVVVLGPFTPDDEPMNSSRGCQVALRWANSVVAQR